MKRLKKLTANSEAEARGIRKGLRAAGVKFQFKSTRRKNGKKRNPAKKRTRRKTKSKGKTVKRRR